jgi:hypothetical protein
MSDHVLREFVENQLLVQPESRVTDIIGQWVVQHHRQPTKAEARGLMSAYARRTGQKTEGLNDTEDMLWGIALLGVTQILVGIPALIGAWSTAQDFTGAVALVVGAELDAAFKFGCGVAVIAIVLRRFAFATGLLVGFAFSAIIWVGLILFSLLSTVGSPPLSRP